MVPQPTATPISEIGVEAKHPRFSHGDMRPDRRGVIRMGFDGACNHGSMYAVYGLTRSGNDLSLLHGARRDPRRLCRPGLPRRHEALIWFLWNHHCR